MQVCGQSLSFLVGQVQVGQQAGYGNGSGPGSSGLFDFLVKLAPDQSRQWPCINKYHTCNVGHLVMREAENREKKTQIQIEINKINFACSLFVCCPCVRGSVCLALPVEQFTIRTHAVHSARASVSVSVSALARCYCSCLATKPKINAR